MKRTIDNFHCKKWPLLPIVLILASCVIRPALTLSAVELSSDGETIIVTIAASQDIRELAQSEHLDVVASLHICGLQERYSTVSYLRSASDENSLPNAYSFLFPSTLTTQTVLPEEGGTIELGWPDTLARENGICLQLKGGNYGTYLRSEIIEIEPAELILLESELPN